MLCLCLAKISDIGMSTVNEFKVNDNDQMANSSRIQNFLSSTTFENRTIDNREQQQTYYITILLFFTGNPDGNKSLPVYGI